MSFGTAHLALEMSDRVVAFSLSLSFVEPSSFEVGRSCGYQLGKVIFGS